MKRAFVAMSGGVDSTACAILLLEQGFEVSGITMELGIGGAVQKAASACRVLGIEHHVARMENMFAERVKKCFCDEYFAGRTPNPCVVCNREIKFGALMDEAMLLGADVFATGHYARIERDDSGYWLEKALNSAKDQSYVLYTLGRRQLSRVLFPLGELSKSDTRRIVRERGLELADSAESQDICFIPDGDYAGFIERFTGKVSPEGDFVDATGRKLGRHRGIIHYTVGQRRGMGVSAEHPLYVLEKSAADNTVRLGSESELMRRAFEAEAVCWTSPFGEPSAPIAAAVRTRYHQKELACLVSPLEGGRAHIELETPARAPAPGQSAVFYLGDAVLGGGIII